MTIFLLMSRISQLQAYKKHFQERYTKLLEKSNDYRFIDENKSDFAAFKAMKIQTKLNKVSYLVSGSLNVIS